MFLWKNAIVLIGLLAMATLPAMRLARSGWERSYLHKLVLCAVLVVCFAVSFVPMLATQFIFGLLMIACFDRRVPMAATYLFFFFWTPAAGSLLDIAGSYVAPVTPFLAFSGALLVGYLTHPENHLRRKFVASDGYVLGFLLIFCICMSVREKPTGVIRTFITYFVPYAASYFTLSRLRIERPELVLRLLVFAAAGAGLLCLFETARHWPLYAGIDAVKREMWILDAPYIWLERGGILRSYGPYAHPLTGGAMLGIAAIGAWGLWQVRGKSLPLILLGAAILLGLGSTLSRSGLVLLAVGIAAFQFLRGRYLIAILVPLIGVLALFGLPILSQADAQFSTTYRLGLITGVPAALGHRIWFGYREAVAAGLLDKFIQGQGIVDLVNTYIALVVQGGVVSLLLFVMLLASTFGHYRAIRKGRPDPEQLVLAQVLLAIQVALIVALALLSSWVAPMQVSFLVLALLVALRAEVKRVRTARKSAPAMPVVSPMMAEADRLPVLR